MVPVPKVNAFLICDHIIQEVGTNKKSLIGIFHNINSPAFPCTHYSLSIYANLVDARGKYDVEIRLVELATGEVAGKAALPAFEVLDRLRPTEICIALQGLTFPRPGKYEFQFLGNDQIIAIKDFEVMKTNLPTGAGR
jgi:hypothetical protein